VTLASGDRFGRLEVVDPAARITYPGGYTRRAVACRCDCGAETIVPLWDLVDGHTKSCGCLQRDLSRGFLTDWLAIPENAAFNRARQLAVSHGLGGTAVYAIWHGMIDRCENPSRKAYRNYGGRGIRVCAEWHDVRVFAAWIEANLGPRPEGKTAGGRSLYSLDRIDNDGDYEPGNVRWATWEQQRANQR
jgi:hypothetical protein